jgi:hypothetical protein
MNLEQHSRNQQRLCRPAVRNGFAFPIGPRSFEGYAFGARLEAQPLKNKSTGSERQSHSAQQSGGAAREKWRSKNNILADCYTDRPDTVSQTPHEFAHLR